MGVRGTQPLARCAHKNARAPPPPRTAGTRNMKNDVGDSGLRRDHT